jgi:very-short-patch-repair endonuclease
MALTRLELKAQRARRAVHDTSTPLEDLLWPSLRAIPGEGQHFRRQVRIGPYLCDFVSQPLGLVVELDGAQHYASDQLAKDAARDAWLAALGFHVLRFANTAVRADPAAVLDSIRAVVEERQRLPRREAPDPAPLPGKRRPRPKR